MNSRKPNQELSVGDIFSQTFSLFSQKFAYFVIPFLAAGVITGLLTMVLHLFIILPAQLAPNSTPDQILNWLPGYIAATIALAVATGFVSWIVGSMAQGISIKYTSDFLEKGEASLGSSFSFAGSRILSILAASLITGVLIFLGALAFVVPGIILAVMFSLVIQTIIIENTGALESLSRSRQLVKDRWLKTFGLLLLLGIIVFVVVGISSVISSPFGVASTLVSSVLSALILPIIPIGFTLYYYSMEARINPEPPGQ